MKKYAYLSLVLLLSITELIAQNNPIKLHPENPHYFQYNGNTMALITSAEHYGAVLNLDFDFKTYLETLADEGMNYTRIFTGSYFEISGESFGIKQNTLGPKTSSVITPWLQVEDAGRLIFDLSIWNVAYFKRLKEFMNLATAHGIIVEVTLFSSIYTDGHWDINPQNSVNNINGLNKIDRKNVHTLNNGKLLQYQKLYVEKMVRELNDFDNFFFEIQNEPWADRTKAIYNIINKEDLKDNDWTNKADFADSEALAWQDEMVEIISQEESNLNQKHLIAQNYTNFKAPIPVIHEDISIINFHYAWPEAVRWNYHYDKVIGFDESGFASSNDQVYRRQAWQFMLSGGGLFNSLDYSFFVGNENGKGKNEAPGGGSTSLRNQLKILSNFLHSFELEKLKPNNGLVKKSPGLIPYVLSDNKNSFALYLRAIGTKNTFIEIETGKGKFRTDFINTLNGKIEKTVIQTSKNKHLKFDLFIPEGELALRITKN